MWPTGDIFFMESRSCLSLCFSNPISWLRALLIEKKSGLEVRRAALRACRWWYPAGEKHTHLCFYIIYQPLTWTSHLGLTRSQYHDSMRSSRGKREEWKRRRRKRERLSVFDILAHGFGLWWQYFPRNVLRCYGITNWQLNIHLSIMCPIRSLYFIKEDFHQPKKMFLDFSIDLFSFERRWHTADFHMCHLAVQEAPTSLSHFLSWPAVVSFISFLMYL